MSPGKYVGVAVPFTLEEIENLSVLAAAQGGTIADLIRARVFSPIDSPVELGPTEDDDLTTMMARIEGIRIRARGRRRE